MPRPNAIVGTAIRTSTGPADPGSLQFQDGSRARLDPGDPRTPTHAQVVDELNRIKHPVYVEVDPDTKFVKTLLIPVVGRVYAVSSTPSGDLDVEIEGSHAIHVLRASNPDFNDLKQALQNALASQATVAITEPEDDPQIIDVREIKGADTSGSALQPDLPSSDRPQSTPREVSGARASELFEIAAGKSCDPQSVQSPCIPFLYPDDGCWARAHEMCRLMIEQGEAPKKVWIYGNLQVNTANNPHCSVLWAWHVAPILHVRNGDTVGPQVIDPSLFQEPVSLADWKTTIQGSTTATLHETDSSVFERPLPECSPIVMDPSFTRTDDALTLYRLKLRLRSVSSVGPPSYAACRTNPQQKSEISVPHTIA